MKLTLSDAPTFRPSFEEFKDPFAYISDIRGQAESYGICKVSPPSPLRAHSGISPAMECMLTSHCTAQYRHLLRTERTVMTDACIVLTHA